jgi:hypothetical protein
MRFIKENENDKIYWVDTEEDGPLFISFDKKKIYNLWEDYPTNMTKEEVELFDKENPFWADFFADREKYISHFSHPKK